MKILAFGHRQRVGKDTSANYALQFLKTTYPKLSCCRLSFGDQIKAVACNMFRWGGLKDAIYYENNPLAKEEILPLIGRTPRQIWIDLGCKMREMHPESIVEMAALNCKAEIAVVSDLRDYSEVRLIERVGGFAVRIVRDSAPVSSDAVDGYLDAFPRWKAEIKNNGTLRELNKSVTDLTQQFVKEYF